MMPGEARDCGDRSRVTPSVVLKITLRSAADDCRLAAGRQRRVETLGWWDHGDR